MPEESHSALAVPPWGPSAASPAGLHDEGEPGAVSCSSFHASAWCTALEPWAQPWWLWHSPGALGTVLEAMAQPWSPGHGPGGCGTVLEALAQSWSPRHYPEGFGTALGSWTQPWSPRHSSQDLSTSMEPWAQPKPSLGSFHPCPACCHRCQATGWFGLHWALLWSGLHWASLVCSPKVCRLHVSLSLLGLEERTWGEVVKGLRQSPWMRW